ncbi:MAG: UDP-glucose dehydrogenase family protein [Gaiellaceae bacterium]
MSDDAHTLAVIGLGKLGSPMVACLASKGFEVIGVDVDEARVSAVAEGRAPVFEPGLEELLAANSARIATTTDVREAVSRADVTFIVVATPSDDHGGFSLRYVQPVCEAIGAALRDRESYHTVVLTSTVMPGSTGGPVRSVLEEASGKRCGVDFGLCYSPEFIALGSVIRDFMNPDFLLVGESDSRAGALLADVYARVCDNGAPVARMNFVNAELAKISVNTFVTTKIAFANMLARVCERLPEADVDVVTAALGMDSRIGPKYLRGAISYGGPCFPRDNLAFAALAREIGAPAFVAEATDRLNRDGIERLAALVQEHLPTNGTAAVLGLSYKPETDVVEESPGLLLAQALAAADMSVLVYDPAALANAEHKLGAAVAYAQSAEEAIRAADVVVLTTAWTQFRMLKPETFEREGAPPVVIDCWRLLQADRFQGPTRYVALGAGSQPQEIVTFD